MESEYFKSMKIILYVMKMNAVFPFLVKNSNTKLWLLFSNVLGLISIIMYLSILHHEVRFIVNHIIKLLNIKYFDGFLQIKSSISFKLFFIVLPMLTWRKSKTTEIFWKNWINFQNEIEKITGTPFLSLVKKKILWISIIGTIYSVVFTFAIRTMRKSDYLSYTTGYITYHNIILVHSILLYWYLTCVFVKSEAQKILNLALEAISKEQDQKLHKLTKIWLDLTDLIQQFTKSHSTMYLGYLILSITNVVSSVYLFVFRLIMQASDSVGHLSGVATLVYFIIILSMCEISDSLFRQVSQQTEIKLLNQNTTGMNVKLLLSFQLFLQTVRTRNMVVDFNGFMKINRSTLISILVVSLNFLIIVKQFNVE